MSGVCNSSGKIQMTDTAQKVTVRVKDFSVEAYQLTIDDRNLLLFTHRQIGEIVGKTKATAQNFLKKHASELPEPIKALIPDRRGQIPLTPPTGAIAYWQKQAEAGNREARALMAALDNKPLEEFEIVTAPFTAATPTQETPKAKSELKLIAEGIEIASNWMKEAGIAPMAVAHWQLNELVMKVPSLKDVITSAQAVIAQNSDSPSGKIASQLAADVSKQVGEKITAAQINKALHELGFQDWANPGKNRERKLTEAGKQYGVALLTTSADGWQGAQLRWFDSVIPIVSEHLRKSSLTKNSLSA